MSDSEQTDGDNEPKLVVDTDWKEQVRARKRRP